MSGDVLYPLLIGGACIVLVGIVHLLTRPRPSRADIHVPKAPIIGEDSIPLGASATALAAWHRANEARLLDFIEFHDRAVLGLGPAGDTDVDLGAHAALPEPAEANSDPKGSVPPDHKNAPEPNDTDNNPDDTPGPNDTRPAEHEAAGEVGRALDAAGEAHPAPDMHAELAALRAAAEAMSEATERGDLDAQERHRVVYEEYRAAWLERLWQFATDRDRVLQMRTLERSD